MKDGKSIGAVGILLIAAAAVLVFGVAGLFPGLTKVLTVILVVAVITVAAVVAAVVYFAFRKPSEHKTVNKGQQISRGRKSLMELRTLNRKTENEEIRSITEDICVTVEKILAELKEQKFDISGLYQFFNYYLPTLAGILKKYISLEAAGSADEKVVENTVSGLTEIKSAMKRQYDSILENRILDLSVEMEALTMACRRDGLLSEAETGGKQ